jgi:hypothetical protein
LLASAVEHERQWPNRLVALWRPPVKASPPATIVVPAVVVPVQEERESDPCFPLEMESFRTTRAIYDAFTRWEAFGLMLDALYEDADACAPIETEEERLERLQSVVRVDIDFERPPSNASSDALSTGAYSENEPLTPGRRSGSRSSASARKQSDEEVGGEVVPPPEPPPKLPRRRGPRCCGCWKQMCASVLFWRLFPWMFAYSIAAVCHLQTLFVATRIFAEFEDPVAVATVWLQSIVVSLFIGWLVADPTVIITRNNLKFTKTIIRSKKYQVIEKYVTIPFRYLVGRVSSVLLRLC